MLGKLELGLDSGGSTVQYSIIITDGRASELLFSESKTSLNWTRIDVKKNVFDFFLNLIFLEFHDDSLFISEKSELFPMGSLGGDGSTT